MNKSTELFSNPSYNPAFLLDFMIGRLKLKNDAALAVALKVAPPVISKMRHRKLPVGDSMLVRMHDASGLQIKVLRAVGGIPA